MAARPRSPIWRYPAALLAVAAVAETCVGLKPWLAATAPALLLAAVIGVAWAGGLGPGLLAAVVAALALDYLLISTDFALAIGVDALVSVLVFLGTAAFVSSLVEARRRAEAAEHRRRVRYETMLLGVGDGVLAADAAGSITFLNAAAEALTGWALADARARPLVEIFPTAEGRPGCGWRGSRPGPCGRASRSSRGRRRSWSTAWAGPGRSRAARRRCSGRTAGSRGSSPSSATSPSAGVPRGRRPSWRPSSPRRPTRSSPGVPTTGSPPGTPAPSGSSATTPPRRSAGR